MKAAEAWSLSQEDPVTQLSAESSAERARILREGEEAKAFVLRYVDWLVTTCNEDIPDESWCPPSPHPSTISVHDITDSDEDYHCLVNSVERHTRCSTAYCLKKKSCNQVAECRFKYPRPTLTESTITFERLGDGTIRATLTTKRNDPRINSHSRLLLQNWRANVDVQIIVDIPACARYMAKYVAKGEDRSPSVKAIFEACLGPPGSGSDTRSIFRRAMIRSIGERDFGAQETAHMLQGLPLISCTFTFITLSLTGSRRIVQDSGELVVQSSLLDHYSARTAHHDLSLLQFASNFTVVKGEVKKCSSPVIVRSFPHYSSDSKGDNYHLYCKFQLIKHKPWHTDISTVWGGGEGSAVVWIDQYHSFLLTAHAQECIPHFSHELYLAQRRLADEDSSEDEYSQQPSEIQDEWMQLCQLNPRFSMPAQDSQVDWPAPARDLPTDILRECPKWISMQRTISRDSAVHRQLPSVDISTLNNKQRRAYELIQSHSSRILSGESPEPLHMLVSGTAGTGKSYLISAIAQLLNQSCALTGTTGMASFLIYGKTLHSALTLPVRGNTQKDLQGASLQKLQLNMKDKYYLIIDEMSMIGHRMLAWVDKRLRQATGKIDSPLGGISVILFGDFAQLPPVGDRPLYALPSYHDLSVHGYHIYQMFTTVVILDQVVRQAGVTPEAQRFRDLLLHLRDGNVTQADWQLLLQRDPSKVSNRSDFADALRLFYDKESVAQYNIGKLRSLGEPIAHINAIHSNSVAATSKADDAGGLHPVVYLCSNARVMLTANLWQEVGLCNGAAGTVYKILYLANHHPPDLPIAVMVDFDTYTGPAFLPDRPSCIPIPPITFEWDTVVARLSRQQLPLQIRYAITIHKSQGQTLDKAVIDIGKSELAAGCTFVAISRLKTLESGLIQPMSFERLQAISKSRNFSTRLQEETRLQRLSLFASEE